jgi:HAD superfamily hydrolase (TIGR01509 family)
VRKRHSFIQAALCDNDGTLVETERVLHAAWGELVALDGKDFRTFDYRRIIGKPDLECCRIVAAHFGLDRDPQEWHDVYKDIAYGLMDNGVPLRPGVEEFLDRLDAAGIPAAIVTSGTMEHVERTLGRTGLLERFALAVTADAPGLVARKPHPAPYLMAARLVGADPAWCLAFEDSPTGIMSARDAGCLTVAIPHEHSPAEELADADLLLPSLAHFSEELAGLAFAFHRFPWD